MAESRENDSMAAGGSRHSCRSLQQLTRWSRALKTGTHLANKHLSVSALTLFIRLTVK